MILMNIVLYNSIHVGVLYSYINIINYILYRYIIITHNLYANNNDLVYTRFNNLIL